MPGTPKDKQCWCKGCTHVAKHEILWNWKKVKVCNDHKFQDGIHWYWDGGHQQACRCKKKGHK